MDSVFLLSFVVICCLMQSTPSCDSPARSAQECSLNTCIFSVKLARKPMKVSERKNSI